MKIQTWSLLVAVLLFGAAAWSEELWDGRADRVNVNKACTRIQVEAADGVLTVSGESQSDQYQYLTFDFPVAPFVFGAKSLALEFRMEKPQPGDSFYIKALDARGQVAASFYTFNRPTEWTRLVCTPGQDSGGVKYFTKNVNAPAGSTVTRLQFFVGRKGKGTPVKIAIRKLQLQSPAAPVAIAGFWSERADQVNFTGPMRDTRAVVADGVLRVRGQGRTAGYDYLTFSLPVAPFVLDGKSIALEFRMEKPQPGDSFYLKALDAQGRVAASFYTFHRPTEWTPLVCTPGRDSGGVKYFAKNVNAPAGSTVTRLQFFVGRKGAETPVEMEIRKLALVASPPVPKSVAARDYGMAVKGGTRRGVAACKDGDGRDAVVVYLMDDLNRRILQIDAASGKCEVIPVPFANPDAVYASLRSRAGKCYALFGKHFTEYDPARKKFTFVQSVPSLAGMAMAEDGHGRIWCATYPDCALYCFDPATRKFTAHGALNRENWAQYPCTLVAAPDGWLYIGIGNTAGQVVAFHADTGEKRLLLQGEERLKPAMFNVRRFSDGKIYARCKEVFYRLAGGAKTRCSAPDAQMLFPPNSGDQGKIIRDFPSGCTLQSIKLADGMLEVLEKDGKTVRPVRFSFANSGAPLMAVDVNSEGRVAGGGFFPFFFGTLDPATGKTTDEFANIQCNTILGHGRYFYIGGYHGGQILRYDPAKPWTLRDPQILTRPDFTANPVFYGRLTPVINRPHALAITPDGKTLAMGGTPAYGMTGGGLALLDTASGKIRAIPHSELAENESPSALAALDNRHLLVGTTVEPGTGGERKAKNASLLLVDLVTGKTVWRSKELGDIPAVCNLVALPGGDALGIDSERNLFRFNLAAHKVVQKKSVAGFGNLPITQGSRLLLRDGDTVWLLFQSGVGRINPADCSVAEFIQVTPVIQVGGGVRDGVLYFSSNRRWYGVPLAPVKKEGKKEL